MSYLTIDIDKDLATGKVTVVTYLDKQHWDEPCICEDPDNEEPDIHDTIRTTHVLDGVRVRGLPEVLVYSELPKLDSGDINDPESKAYIAPDEGYPSSTNLIKGMKTGVKLGYLASQDKSGAGEYSDLTILSSPAGFYIGTLFTEHGSGYTEPGSRESEYFEYRVAAERALANNTWTQRTNP